MFLSLRSDALFLHWVPLRNILMVGKCGLLMDAEQNIQRTWKSWPRSSSCNVQLC